MNSNIIGITVREENGLFFVTIIRTNNKCDYNYLTLVECSELLETYSY
jgi:hypothetical protein